jgi:hypothetical protein
MIRCPGDDGGKELPLDASQGSTAILRLADPVQRRPKFPDLSTGVVASPRGAQRRRQRNSSPL